MTCWLHETAVERTYIKRVATQWAFILLLQASHWKDSLQDWIWFCAGFSQSHNSIRAYHLLHVLSLLQSLPMLMNLLVSIATHLHVSMVTPRCIAQSALLGTKCSCVTNPTVPSEFTPWDGPCDVEHCAKDRMKSFFISRHGFVHQRVLSGAQAHNC